MSEEAQIGGRNWQAMVLALKIGHHDTNDQIIWRRNVDPCDSPAAWVSEATVVVPAVEHCESRGRGEDSLVGCFLAGCGLVWPSKIEHWARQQRTSGSKRPHTTTFKRFLARHQSVGHPHNDVALDCRHKPSARIPAARLPLVQSGLNTCHCPYATVCCMLDAAEH